MNQLHNGRVPSCLSSAITLVPALSEETFPIFPEHRPSYAEREAPGSSVTSFGASLAANDARQSACPLASNFIPSDLHTYNEIPNARFSSQSYVTEQPEPDTPLPSTYSPFKGNSSSLRMAIPEVSEQIFWNQETLQGVFDYPASVYSSNQQNVTTVDQQIQDSITMDPNTHVAKPNEWFSTGSSMQLLGSAGSVLKAVDARSATPQSYSYCHTQNSASLFSCDEVSTDNLPSSNTTPAKSRMRWTPERHEQFVDAVNMLGGSEKATPRAVQKVMKVEGLTIYHVKSHLQKYRAVQHRPESSGGGVSAMRSSQTDEVSLLQLKGSRNVEGLRTQIGLQKQLHEQLEMQRKLQLQVEEQSKYLEMIIAKQNESLKKLGALPGFRDRSQPILGDNKACEERMVHTNSAELIK